jgi:hypothetical protein
MWSISIYRKWGPGTDKLAVRATVKGEVTGETVAVQTVVPAKKG